MHKSSFKFAFYAPARTGDKKVKAKNALVRDELQRLAALSKEKSYALVDTLKNSVPIVGNLNPLHS